MMKRILFCILTALLVAACVVESSDNRLVLRTETVSVGKGSIFVSVKSAESWTLEIQWTGGEEDWLTLSRTSGSGSINSIVLSYTKNTSSEPRTAVITAVFAKERISATFTQKGLSSIIEGGEGTELPTWTAYPGLKSDVLRGWMELPVVAETEGCAWVFHDMTITSPYYSGRNYSIYYDAANMMPRWVAYPLNKGLYGSGGRTDRWEQWDPKIPAEYQPSTQYGGWKVSGYDRGHMIPSADRVANDEANWQTFYPTNMTVQVGAKFNQRIWSALEGRVRVWSHACDTLYVVTGAIPSDSFITDRGGNRVNVPAAYYKALLQYKASASEQEKYMGIAFYLENRDYDESDVSAGMAMSISALESMTDMNFFVNLPDRYRSGAEDSLSPAYWGL